MQIGRAGAVRKDCIRPGRRRREWPTGRVVLIVIAAISCASVAWGGGLTAPGGGHLPGKAIRLTSAEWRANTTAPKASTGKRYVALGDSVPYGHGLANPTTSTQDGLPPNQGPSPLAWPSWVDARVPGLAALSLRPTGCALTGSGGQHYDQLAVSGAPAQDNQWTGKDSADCPADVIHKAVVPDEIRAADLRARPPTLVTIQAGADDIDFAGCLKAILGVPLADNCVTHTANGYLLTSKAIAELVSAKAGLEQAIAEVLANAPNAQILLVDYYQIIPAASTPVYGTSAICRDIRGAGPARRSFLQDAADYVQARLNDAIKAAANSSPNVAFVDIANKFAGHEMCTSQPWVFDGGLFSNWRTAHPTEHGQSVIAQAVIDRCATLKGRCLGHQAPAGWTAAEAPNPPNWSGNSELAAVTCPAVTTCVAIGDYTDTSQQTRGLLLTQSGGSWTTSELPAPANAGWFADPYAISCASDTSCTATGYYLDSSGNQQGLLLTQSSSGWSATEAPLPANAAANPNVTLSSIACPSTATCVAAGTYTDSSGSTQGLLLTWSGSSWRAAEAPLPSNAASNPGVNSMTVSCPNSSGCAVATYYFDTSDLSQALLLWGLGTSWAKIRPPLPANGVQNRESELQSAYCLPGANCVATGFYSDSSGTYGNTHGLLLTGTGTSWTATEAPTPASTSEAQVHDVTCYSTSACFATGEYLDGATNTYRGFFLTGSGTSWMPANEPLPANASTPHDTGISLSSTSSSSSLTCPSSAACVLVGSYTDSSGNSQGLLITGYGTSWTATQAPVPPGAATVPRPSLGSVACTSASTCISVGSYLQTISSNSQSWQGLLETGPA